MDEIGEADVSALLSGYESTLKRDDKINLSLAQLYTALAKFQAECPEINFDKTVSTKQYKFKFASLGNLIAKTKKPMSKYGLAIIQAPAHAPAGLVAVQTTLTHSGGGAIATVFNMDIPKTNVKDSSGKIVGTKHTPQDVGSAISYARRYAYAAILGLVAEEDNDGMSESELYQDSPMDKAWLKDACEKIGVTDKNVMKALHENMLKMGASKDAVVLKKLID